MKKAQKQPGKKFSWVKLVLFGAFCFVTLIFAVVWNKYGAVLAQAMFLPQWRKDFEEAGNHWNDDPTRAAQLMEKCIEQAVAAKATPLQVMALHHDYAELLYLNRLYKRGDEEIDKAIAAAPSQPGPLELDLLANTYQTRGWERHKQYYADVKALDGIEDQERSVEIAQKAFGQNSQQAIDKLASLALMYAEHDQKDKAKVILDQVLNASDNIKGCESCAWYAYTMKARILAGQKDYKEALKAYLHAVSLVEPKEQKDHIWQEFVSGLNLRKPVKAPELNQVEEMFNRGQYKEIDALAAQLRKSGVDDADGYWHLDMLYWIVEGVNSSAGQKARNEAEFEQRISALRKWIKEEPKSAVARIALAETYIEYAWLARGGDWASTVTDKGWQLYHERVATAKRLLDESPQLCKECPRATFVYDQIALAGEMDAQKYKALLDACHKDWPDYTSVDISRCWYLLPRWHGEEYETQRYIQERAAALGGTKGDVARTRMAWYISRHLNDAWGPDSPLKWEDVKRGFIVLFKRYPNDVDPRIAFMNMSRRAKQMKDFESVFDLDK